MRRTCDALSRILVLAVCLLGSMALAANENPAPDAAPAAAPEQELSAVVTAVVGLVQVREAEDQPWIQAKPGMKLAQGAEFRTGPRSTVQFQIPPAQTVTLDRLGTVKLLTAIAESGKIKTDLGLAYGRTRYDIRKGGGQEYESTIRSPSATLSVRGTRVGIQDGPFGYVAWSTQSRAVLNDRSRRTQFSFGDNTGMSDKSKGPSDQERQDGTVDPGDSHSRDDTENNLISQRPSGDLDNSQHGFVDARQLLDRDTNGQRIIDQYAGTGYLPGYLLIDLYWGPTEYPTDLDMQLISPAAIDGGKVLASYGGGGPGTVTSLPSGGMVNTSLGSNGDDTDGSKTAGGHEQYFWSQQFPAGTYTVRVVPYFLGSETTVDYLVNVSVLAPGQSTPQQILAIEDTVTQGGPTRETDFTIGTGTPTTSVEP
ncbi:MAG: FecR domain-containing protein [Phycisphaeraceae bacterium]|nr:FecR domain-containing protein [Phycisphaeraceae bacterium]